MKTQATWRHCCVNCRYAVDQPEEESISIRYLDSPDDFNIVAGSLASAFRLMGAHGWQLVAVVLGHAAGKYRGRRLADGGSRVDRYYFKRGEADCGSPD